MKNLGGGFKYVLFSPLLGEMIQVGEHIFQMGWFNHQLDEELVRWFFVGEICKMHQKSSQKFGESAGWLVGGNSDRGATPECSAEVGRRFYAPLQKTYSG